MVCMHLGGVLARGKPDVVLRDPAVMSSYLGEDDAAINRSGPGKPSPARRKRAAPANATSANAAPDRPKAAANSGPGARGRV